MISGGGERTRKPERRSQNQPQPLGRRPGRREFHRPEHTFLPSGEAKTRLGHPAEGFLVLRGVFSRLGLNRLQRVRHDRMFHRARDIAENPPALFRIPSRDRLHRPAETLHAALQVRDGSLLFVERERGQHDIGVIHARVGVGCVEHDEFGSLERLPCQIAVRMLGGGIAAEKIHSANFALRGGGQDFSSPAASVCGMNAHVERALKIRRSRRENEIRIEQNGDVDGLRDGGLVPEPGADDNGGPLFIEEQRTRRPGNILRIHPCLAAEGLSIHPLQRGSVIPGSAALQRGEEDCKPRHSRLAVAHHQTRSSRR